MNRIQGFCQNIDIIHTLPKAGKLVVIALEVLALSGGVLFFGTQGMGYYSLFFVGVVYLLASIESDGSSSETRRVRELNFYRLVGLGH